MIDLARLFSPAKNALAGLDIGRHAIRMVELSRHRNGQLQLQRYASETLADGAVSDEGIEDLEHVMTAAQRLWNKSGSDAGKVSIGIPASAITAHNFVIDHLPSATQSPASVEMLAREAIAPLLDYYIADAYLDFCITAPTSTTSTTSTTAGRHNVLVAATRKDTVEDRVAIAESLNLRAVIADADSYAAHAALSRSRAAASPSADTPALLHLDSQNARLSLLTDEDVIHACEYPHQRLAGTQVSALDIESNAAAAARELRTWQARHPGHQIDLLVVSGIHATTPGLIAALQQHCNIAVAIADPFADMSLAAGIDAARLAVDAPAYLVACGLALRRFN